MIVALYLLLGLAIGYGLSWREAAAFRVAARSAAARVDHLLELLARKEAPAEQAWYMSDKDTSRPFPADAVWDEFGLDYHTPEESDTV